MSVSWTKTRGKSVILSVTYSLRAIDHKIIVPTVRMEFAALQRIVINQRCLRMSFVQIHVDCVDCHIRRNKYHRLVIAASAWASNKGRYVSWRTADKVLWICSGFERIKGQDVGQVFFVPEEICVEISFHVFKAQCFGPNPEFIDVAVEKTFFNVAFNTIN